MKSLVPPLFAALLGVSISYAEEPKQPKPAKPTAEEIDAYKAAIQSKLDEIEARLQQHRQLAHRAKGTAVTPTDVAD